MNLKQGEVDFNAKAVSHSDRSAMSSQLSLGTPLGNPGRRWSHCLM